jgi:hypothetical protein
MEHKDVEHETLGTLRYDGDLNWYEGRVEHGGKAVPIYLAAVGEKEFDAAAARAVHVASRLDDYERRAKEYAVEQLLKIKNNGWLEDGESPVGADEFKEKMSLQEIVFRRYGAVDFHHRDGNLFWGHGIVVSLDGGDNFVKADIPG